MLLERGWTARGSPTSHLVRSSRPPGPGEPAAIVGHLPSATPPAHAIFDLRRSPQAAFECAGVLGQQATKIDGMDDRGLSAPD